jgi:hypothetical protein
MPNYKNSKIYKLVSLQTDKIYIGSTTQPLYKRFGKHKTVGYNCMSKELIKYDDCKIILIENFECNNKEELHARERYYIDLYKDIIINKRIPTRTHKEYKKQYYQEHKLEKKQYDIEYRNKNNEKEKENKKKYYEDNKEKRKEQMKKYYEDNKEKRKEQMKKYREQNKEKRKELSKNN